MEVKLKELVLYKIWADEKILNIIENLSEDQVSVELTGFEESIQSLLFKLYENGKEWIDFMKGKEYQMDISEITNILTIIEHIRNLNDEILNYVIETDLHQEHSLQWKRSDNPIGISTERVIFHYINYSAYYRGQLTAMLLLEEFIMDPPTTDYVPYYYETKQHKTTWFHPEHQPKDEI